MRTILYISAPERVALGEEYAAGDGRESVECAQLIAVAQFLLIQIGAHQQQFLLALALIYQLRKIAMMLAEYVGIGLGAHIVESDDLVLAAYLIIPGVGLAFAIYIKLVQL